jgi:multicomponent Na+:H+ antiporter subunit D
MADLSVKIADVENRSLVDICAVLFFVGFGIKSAVFPLYFWLPASYHTPPSAVSAIFGGLLTKVGVYALIRVFTLIFIEDLFLQTLILGIAFFTIISGAFGALINNNMRKIFSYLIICHIGFIIGGLGIYTEIAIAGALFYLIHDIMVKTNLYLISGLIYRLKGNTNIQQLGNIYKDYPKISVLIAVVLFSLVGVPPLSGFWPKISLFEAGFANGNYWYVGALIFGSLITLIIAGKIWAEVFWKNADTIKPYKRFIQFDQLKNLQKAQFVVPIFILSVISLYIGLGAEHVQQLVNEIAHDLKDNQSYIDAVLKQEE